MDTLSTWLATAMLRFEPPDIAKAPPDYQAQLANTFHVWDGSELVTAVRADLERLTAGQASLDYADPPAHGLVRGPVAYLRLTRYRRLALTPSGQPVQFDV